MDETSDMEQDLKLRVWDLRLAFDEAEAVLAAIRSGEVDGFVVATPEGDKLYALQNADSPYRTIVERMEGGALLLMCDGSVLYANPYFLRLVGRQEVAPFPLERLVAKEHRGLLGALLDGAATETCAGEVDLALPGGSRVPVRIALTRLGAEQDAPLCAVVTDLTDKKFFEGQLERRVLERTIELDAANARLRREVEERRRSEEARQKSEERFRVMADGLPQLVWVTDPEGDILFVNRAYCEFFGATVEEIQARGWQPLVHPEDAAQYINTFQESRSRRAHFRAQARVRRADGQWRWIDSHGAPWFSPDGTYLGCVGTSPDITEQKLAEEEMLRLNQTLELRVAERTADLERSHEALRQAERLAAIGQTVATLSHESRNSLNNSGAALQMLRRIVDRDDQRRYVEMALKAQSDLARVYEEVRDFAAPVNLERTEASLDALWYNAWRDLATQREGRMARLVEAPQGVDLRCEVDYARMTQVFRNLFENALGACTDPVEIAVICSETEVQGQPGVEVRVRDNGPGLRAEEAERIFDAFYTTKKKGTGLGLTIVRRLVEAHGGHVEARPGPEGGLEVVIRLPRGGEGSRV